AARGHPQGQPPELRRRRAPRARRAPLRALLRRAPAPRRARRNRRVRRAHGGRARERRPGDNCPRIRARKERGLLPCRHHISGGVFEMGARRPFFMNTAEFSATTGFPVSTSRPQSTERELYREVSRSVEAALPG